MFLKRDGYDIYFVNFFCAGDENGSCIQTAFVLAKEPANAQQLVRLHYESASVEIQHVIACLAMDQNLSNYNSVHRMIGFQDACVLPVYTETDYCLTEISRLMREVLASCRETQLTDLIPTAIRLKGIWKTLEYYSPTAKRFKRYGILSLDRIINREMKGLEAIDHLFDVTGKMNQTLSEVVNLRSDNEPSRELPKVLDDRYAESIAKNPDLYDAIEIQGVRDISDSDDAGTYVEPDNDNPQFFSVYLHLKTGGVDCVGDHQTPELALEYANVLRKRSNDQWPIYDFYGCAAANMKEGTHG